MEKKSKYTKQEMGIMAVSIITIIIVIIGVTYSYFTVTIIGNDEASSVNISVGKFDVDFISTEYFNNPSMMLVKDDERDTKADTISFSVKNKDDSTLAAKYDIYLVDLNVSSNFKSPDFKWELLRNGITIASGNFATVGTATELRLTPSVISLPLGNEDNYTLRAWLSETDQDQSVLFNGSFTAKVSIQAGV